MKAGNKKLRFSLKERLPQKIVIASENGWVSIFAWQSTYQSVVRLLAKGMLRDRRKTRSSQ